MDETVSVRLARDEDSDAIRELTREAYAAWVPVIGLEPVPMTVDYADALRRHRFDLLHVDERLAALLETVPKDDALLIENVAVRPAFQGRGYGRRLLALAEELAEAGGMAGVRLYTNKAFARNVRLYAAAGYRIEREEPFRGGTTVHMFKPRARA